MYQSYVNQYNSALGENTIFTKSLSLESNIQVFIIIESNNSKIVPPIGNKIIDYLLDTIKPGDVYNTFSVTLESINFFIKTLQNDEETQLDSLSIVIALLEKNVIHFAKTGQGNCYLINSKSEAVQVSDPLQKSLLFDSISSGRLGNGETFLLFSQDIQELLNQSDWKDITLSGEVEDITKNLVHIFDEEEEENNIAIIGIQSHVEIEEKALSQTWEKAKYLFFSLLDNNFFKKINAHFLLGKEKLEQKSKLVKNLVFVTGIVVSAFLLFTIISGVLGKSMENSKSSQYKNNLIEAREYIQIANNNIANKETFELNINKAVELLDEVRAQQLFANDVDSILEDIAIIKKQFNGIESFEGNTSNLVFKGEFGDGIKLVEANKKLYVIGQSSIYGPILPGSEIKHHTFKDLEIDDLFTDGVAVGDTLVLTTKKGRVVLFGKDSQFSYINVIGQTSWQGSPIVSVYNDNLYMTNKEQNQIFKHTPSSGSYTQGVSYLESEDSKHIGMVTAIGIDGGIFILNQDGKMFKLFSAPKYRVESIVLNNLPQNYAVTTPYTQMIVSSNLNYIYLELDGKIFIFQPNTKVYTDTKNLTYIGQIEGKNEDILSFFVPRDGEIQVLTKSGIYKINFEVSEDKIMIK